MNRNKKILKKAVMATLSASMILTSGGITTFAAPATTNEQSDRETKNAQISMTAATQGMVLLENNNDVLPIAVDGNIALYGGGAVKTVKGGTGSGDVNTPLSSVLEYRVPRKLLLAVSILNWSRVYAL